MIRWSRRYGWRFRGYDWIVSAIAIVGAVFIFGYICGHLWHRAHECESRGGVYARTLAGFKCVKLLEQ